jgi:hypothetical protein
MQIEAHVEIRILDYSDVPDILRVSSTFDFTLFDGTVSYLDFRTFWVAGQEGLSARMGDRDTPGEPVPGSVI